LKRFDRSLSKILLKSLDDQSKLDDQPNEDLMSDPYQSLAHSKWDCNFHPLAKQTECQIVEGHLMRPVSEASLGFLITELGGIRGGKVMVGASLIR
jgi:hypothetical protein